MGWIGVEHRRNLLPKVEADKYYLPYVLGTCWASHKLSEKSWRYLTKKCWGEGERVYEWFKEPGEWPP